MRVLLKALVFLVGIFFFASSGCGGTSSPPVTFPGAGQGGSSPTGTVIFQTIPIVSDNSEISNTFIFTKYKTLNDSAGMVGRMSLYLRGVNSIGDDDVRISKRAYVPYSRLRGFEKNKEA